jgi:hypothetical protein
LSLTAGGTSSTTGPMAREGRAASARGSSLRQRRCNSRERRLSGLLPGENGRARRRKLRESWDENCWEKNRKVLTFSRGGTRMNMCQEHNARDLHLLTLPPTAVWEALPQTAVLFSATRTGGLDIPYHRCPCCHKTKFNALF